MNNSAEITPKRRRKLKISHIIIVLLLVIAAGFLFFRLVSKSKLQAKLDAIRAAGYPVTCAELDAWYAIPEFTENAADTIIEAFSHYYEWDEEYLELLPVAGRAQLPARTEPIGQETKTLIAEYLTDNRKALELLHKGAAIENSRYPVDFTLGFGALMPYLSDIKKGAKMLKLEAILHAENAEPQLAADSVTAIFGVARSLAKEPMLVSQLVLLGCQRLGVSSLERVLNKTELIDERLVKIGQTLVNAENCSSMSRAFAGERCITSDFLRDPTPQDFFGGRPFPLPVMAIYKATGLADTDALLYIDFMTNYIEAMQLEPHQRKEAAEAAEAKLNEISKIHILLHIVAPALSRCVTYDLRCIAGLRTAQVAVAIQRYRLAAGSVPNTLAELLPTYLDSIPKDPFDGKELRYKKLDIGFVVYSIGEDEKDDGGTERPPRDKRKRDSSVYDITFIMQR